jgi:hypothetical protein
MSNEDSGSGELSGTLEMGPEAVMVTEAELAAQKGKASDGEAPPPKPSKEPEKPKKGEATGKDEETEPGENPKGDADPEADDDDPKARGKKVDTLLDGIRRREKKSVEIREQLRTDRETFNREVETTRGQLASQQRELATAQQQVRDILEYSQRDPIAFLEKVHGISAEDLGRRILNGGKPSPEEEQRRGAGRVERLEAQVKQLLDEKAEGQKRQAAEQANAAERADFVRKVRGSAPLAEMVKRLGTDDEILDEAYTAAHAIHRKTGRTPSHEEVAREMLARYNKFAASDQGSGTRTDQDTATADQGSEKVGAQGSSAEATAPAVTNRAAAKRASAPVDLLALELKDPAAARKALLEKLV